MKVVDTPLQNKEASGAYAIETAKTQTSKQVELARPAHGLDRARLDVRWNQVEENEVRHDSNGNESLADIFDGLSQLIVNRFYVRLGLGRRLPEIFIVSDHSNGTVAHLSAPRRLVILISNKRKNAIMNMISKLHILRTLSLLALIVCTLMVCTSVPGQPQSNNRVDPAVARLGRGFVSNTVKVNGTTLHYVRGGTGPALLLLHGFPQDWYEFRHVMPRLAKKFTVVAVDLRGIGGSPPTRSGYDAATMAEDIFQLTQALKLERVYIAGHDVGGSVTYAFLRLHPQATRGVMILETPIAGLEPWEEVKSDPRLWHIGFHQAPKIPEGLIGGREFFYFREFLNRGVLDSKVITDADVNHYAKSYAGPGQLHAEMEVYRAFADNEKFNTAQRSAIDVPIVLVGGDHSFGKLLPKVADALRTHGCAMVTIELIKNTAHYLFEEQPEIVSELIERYASS